MKKFKELRESHLEEKLKALEPAGEYIRGFVNSDNPKFAGKSKAKRIQMAIAASYAAKGKSRNEEVEIVYESNIEATSGNSRSHISNLSNPTVNGVTHQGKQIGLITKQPSGEYHAHHSAAKLAHAQSGTFDSKDKAHQFIRNAHAQAIKSGTLKTSKMSEVKEEVETFNEEDSTSLKMTTAGADVIHKDTGNKLGTVYQPTASRSSHVAVVHGPRGGPERKEFSSFKDAHNHIKKTYGLDEGMLEVTKKDAVKQYTDIQKYKPNFNKPKSKPNPEEFLRISLGNTKKQQGVKEGMFDTVKTVAKKMGKALTGGSDQDQLKNLQKKMGLPQTGKKPTSK